MSTYYEELIASDWLGRNSDNYTHQRKFDRLAGKEVAFSKYIFDYTGKQINNKRKILLTREHLSTVLRRMIKKKSFNLEITPGLIESRQAGNKISVGIGAVLSPEVPTFNDALDICLGFGVHEAAHLLWSTYNEDDIKRSITASVGPKRELAAAILNAIEDERIEALVGDIFPGYSNYISATKEFAFSKLDQAVDDAGNVGEIGELMSCLLKLIRYPATVNKDFVNKHEKYVRQFQSILTPYPKNTDEVIATGKAIYDLLEKFIQDQQGQGQSEEEQEEQEGKGQGQGKGKGKQKQNKPKKNKQDDKSNSSNSGDSGEEDEEKKDDEEEEENGGSDEDSVKEDNKPQAETDKEVIEQLNNIAQAVANLVKNVDENPPSKVVDVVNAVNTSPSDEQYVDESYRLFPARNAKSTEIPVIFKDIKPKANRYNTLFSEVSKYSASLRAKLEYFNRSISTEYKGLTEGTFDEDELVAAKCGNKNVYKQNAFIHNNGATVGLLIDESGSMGREYSKNAAEIAILFESVLRNVNNIDFYCYGHTTNESDGIHSSEEATLIHVYYEGKTGHKTALGEVGYYNTNRDGHAILEVVGRIRKFTNKHLVLFVISDGQPSASTPNGIDPITYTKQCVDYVQRNCDTSIIHIAIKDGVPSARMFTDYLTFTNLGTLVRDVGQVLGRVISKIQQPEITLE